MRRGEETFTAMDSITSKLQRHVAQPNQITLGKKIFPPGLRNVFCSWMIPDQTKAVRIRKNLPRNHRINSTPKTTHARKPHNQPRRKKNAVETTTAENSLWKYPCGKKVPRKIPAKKLSWKNPRRKIPPYSDPPKKKKNYETVVDSNSNRERLFSEISTLHNNNKKTALM